MKTTTATRFQEVPPQSLVVYSVGYEVGGQTYYPPDIDREQLLFWLRRAYPLSDVQVVQRTYFAASGRVPHLEAIPPYRRSTKGCCTA